MVSSGSVSPYLEFRRRIIFHRSSSSDVCSLPATDGVSLGEKIYATGRWRSSLINAVWWWSCGALNPRGRRYLLISLYLCITVILHMPAVFGLGEEGRLKRIDNVADAQTVAR